MPVIAIVGRPNVGKSSLLNALAHKRISIVQDMPGVTRDRVSIPLWVGEGYVELVDTGGYGFDDPDLTEQIKHQIELAMSRADLVLFIVDCQAGLTTADSEIAQLLRRKAIKTVLLANKCDSEKADTALGEFARLGFDTPIGVSAMTDRGIDRICTAIQKNVDLKNAPKEMPDPQMMVAIVGKRNAGKSTLVNSIAQLYDEKDMDRVIVSEVPGTTRDSVDVRFEKDGKTLIVIDTAGVRKKRHMVTNDIEFYSFHRAQRSIRRADVVMLLLDGTEAISEPDKKLAQYIAEQHKPVILVVNKWDLAMGYAREQHMANKKNEPIRDEELMEKFVQYAHAELKHLDYAPLAFVTAKDGKNVQAVLDLSQHLFKQANERVTTGKLNRAVKQIFDERVPTNKHGKRIKVFYATQIETAPPTIALIVNAPDLVDASYQRFMINRFRELLPYSEVPIKLLIRGRTRADDDKQMIDSDEPRKPANPRNPAKRVRSRSKKS